jgi:hypothetical protein
MKEENTGILVRRERLMAQFRHANAGSSERESRDF